jgi:hypothetical protein
MKVTRSRGTAGRCGSGHKHTGTTFTAPPQRCRHPSWRRQPTGSHGQWSSERDVVLAVSFPLDDGRTPVSELVHDQSADSATTGAPTSRRRAPRSTRVVLLLSMLAAASMVTAGCRPTTASTSSGSTTGSATPVAGSSSVVAEDPDHGTAQSFPAPGTCHEQTVPNGSLPDPASTPGAVDPHVIQAMICATICRPGGYTSTVRPPASVPTA